ncbi:tetratricopeptide repeat protein [Pseudomonas sp. CAU 1711]|uniref:tetratricopeptide repeat protein n=1 Tax=Pseudomonas sp. CAU 1711 TaxID=3140356 RepID=UPI003260CAA1
MRAPFLLLLLLPFGAPCTAAEQACDSPNACNQAGSAAYRAGLYARAIEAFERQLRRTEQHNGDAHGAEELALNNLMLANLKAGEPGMARAWLEVALERGFVGAATRHNLAKVAAALDFPALAGSVEGHYVRYAGQGLWSSLDIRRQGQAHVALFNPVRAGARVEDYGPAAIGELRGRLAGSGAHFSLGDAGLAPGCAVELLWSGADMRVLELPGEGCQAYGGAGISVAGRYYKTSTVARF